MSRKKKKKSVKKTVKEFFGASDDDDDEPEEINFEHVQEVEPVAFTDRSACLETAMSYVMSDRQTEHGEPEDVFADVANLWTAYTGFKLQPHDVCAMMGLLKIGRIRHKPQNADNWIDLAGYAACGSELATGSPKEEAKTPSR